jgi:hypothetical protein
MMRNLDEDFAYETLRQRKLDEFDSLTQQLANAVQMLSDQDFEYNRKTNDLTHTASELISEMKQQLAEREKQIVLLREMVEKVMVNLSGADWLAANDALDATQDLSGYILCDAEPVGTTAPEYATGRCFAWITRMEFKQPIYKARKQP